MSRQTLLGTIRWSILAVVVFGATHLSAVALAQTEPAASTHVMAVETTGPSEAKDTHAEKAGAAKHGEEGGEPSVTELNPIPFIFTILIFVTLLIVLRFTAWKPILAGLKAREDSIRKSIEAAAKARADADRTTQELEARMAEAQRQGALALQQAKADALKLAESIRAQAEAESAALKDRTLRDIEAAKQQALSDINGRAADLGISVARKILQREVTVADQQRIVEESLAELGTTKI
jgi:F-type H+-transporting ATPase subunit b